MGEPASFSLCVNWIFDIMGVKREEGDVGNFLKGLPFRARFEVEREEKDEESAKKGEQEVKNDEKLVEKKKKKNEGIEEKKVIRASGEDEVSAPVLAASAIPATVGEVEVTA